MTAERRDTATPGTLPRVLLVEDEAAIRNHLAEALSDEYRIETASSGTEALRAVMHSRPDLIVTDIVMPEMDGVELLRVLRSVPSTEGIPVLLISGHAPEELRIEGFREGADGYLAKPYSEAELRALIGSLLRTRHRAEEAHREALEQASRQAVAERAALLESITDAFFALDRQWRFIYVNQRALGHFGKTRQELLGKSLWEIVPAARGTDLEREYSRALLEQRPSILETRSPLSGGWLEVRVYPTGQGLAAYFRDVSDRKRAEEALKESDRRKDEFLALLAHELRNPAIERARSFRPDLIFMDIGMPEMDGLEAARQILAQPDMHAVQIVALTGWDQGADRERTRAAGMAAHLVKPVVPERLDEILGLLEP